MSFAADPKKRAGAASSEPELANEPGVDGALWSAMRSDPTIGVAVIREDGFTVWCNERAAIIFLGDKAKPPDAMGKYWREVFPEPWIQERLALLQQVKRTGKGVLIRTLWRGRQQGSWVRLIEPDPEEENAFAHNAPLGADGKPLALYLTITRRMDAREFAEVSAKRDVEIVDSGVVSLGELGKLTARELEVLALLGQGLTVAEIGDVLHRSPKTVDRHRDKLAKKLGGANRVELARIAFEAGLELDDATRRRT